MKRKCLLLTKSSCFSVLVAIMGCLIFSAEAVTAQASASVAPADPISTVDLPHTEWKNPVDYEAVLTTEQSNTTQTLASPALKEPLRSSYKAYERLLVYMKADLIANIAVEEIAESNYKKVTLEAPTEPAFAGMESADFDNLYNALLQLLQQ